MRRLWIGLALATAALARPAAAPAQPPSGPTVIVLRPAPAPMPALKYRIIAERRELVPGNAAVFYHRAIEMLLQRRRPAAPPRGPKGEPEEPAENAIARWIAGPAGEIPRDRARALLETYRSALHEVEVGATRRECDWEFEFRTEGIMLLLPDIQEMRSLGRLVALRARLAALDGKTDEAVHWLQVGFTVARHVGQGTTLIQALVGCAMTAVLTPALVDLIQAPGTPSLYWALASRPRPLIDMTTPLEWERTLVERELPTLHDLGGPPWSEEQARRFGDEFLRKLRPLTRGTAPNPSAPAPGGAGQPPRLEDVPDRLALAAVVIKLYPDAKRALIAQGRPAAEVEALPALQAVALYSFQSYERFRDDLFKWAMLPYWQSATQEEETLRREKDRMSFGDPLRALLIQLVPAINAARLASVRVERQLDALQCVEAIRLYAAAHDGALPPSLEALTDAPAPLDPATGRPFSYTRRGDTAALDAPRPPGAPDHPAYLIRYELKLAR